jgi:hypothetical protein
MKEQISMFQKCLTCILLLSLLFAPQLAAQTPWIKFPKKFGLRTQDIGPRPGTPAPEGKETAEYKRVYNYPANLRLIVRTTCGDAPKERDMIERAKQLTQPRSPVQEIDWKRIRDNDKVTYYAVVYSRSETVTMSLKNEGNKWVIASKTNSEKENWHTQVIFPNNGRSCISQDELNNKTMQTQLHNILIEKTMKNFRGKS